MSGPWSCLEKAAEGGADFLREGRGAGAARPESLRAAGDWSWLTVRRRRSASPSPNPDPDPDPASVALTNGQTTLTGEQPPKRHYATRPRLQAKFWQARTPMSDFVDKQSIEEFEQPADCS